MHWIATQFEQGTWPAYAIVLVLCVPPYMWLGYFLERKLRGDFLGFLASFPFGR